MPDGRENVFSDLRPFSNLYFFQVHDFGLVKYKDAVLHFSPPKMHWCQNLRLDIYFSSAPTRKEPENGKSNRDRRCRSGQRDLENLLSPKVAPIRKVEQPRM